MDNLEESRLSMYLTFGEYKKDYTTITDALPNFKENDTFFSNTVLQIQVIAEQQKLSKKGITTNKNLLKLALIVLVADYARKLWAYAKFTNNVILADEVNIPEGKLKQTSDTGVRDYAQIIFDRAQPILSSLTSYGISEATQTLLANSISNYNATIGQPGSGRVQGSQTTKLLKAHFKIAETALANMDTAVEIVRLTEPEFYAGYKNARKVIVLGTGTISVKGMITDAATGEPIKGVTASFIFDGVSAKAKASNGKPKLVKKTAQKGGFNIKSLPSGTYQVTLKKVGYADQMVTINVNDNEKTELKVSLGKY